MDIEHLVFANAPKRVGPFSHAVTAGGFCFVTGQMPTLPDTPSKLITGGIIEQTHQVMKNLEAVLTNSKCSFSNIVFVRIYLVNFQDFDTMNKVYEEYFDPKKLPARTCIGVTGLAVGASIEIDLIAKL
jgi:2-iminobutanoate/2-iminopropanoate deaminase